MKKIELNDFEKKILLQIEDGFATLKILTKHNGDLSEIQIKEVLDKFISDDLISHDPYKDKDLEKYLGLKGNKEKEDFKKESPPSFFVTKKGRDLLGLESF